MFCGFDNSGIIVQTFCLLGAALHFTWRIGDNGRPSGADQMAHAKPGEETRDVTERHNNGRKEKV